MLQWKCSKGDDMVTLIQAVVSELINHVCSGDIAEYRDVTTIGQIEGEYNKHLESVLF